ncbi:glutaminase A [Nibricoccus sp. IMCC34717]|uniref:glutaminase A n=1 Tax=Nibricoccus sp. IMCC34717 TaxID=3034021 RepID=UPI00384AADF8
MSHPNLSINSIQDIIQEIHQKHASLGEGTLPDYIPELLTANPRWFGIAITTVDGRQYVAGDCSVPFTIQSISKPFVYGLALDEIGLEAVARKIDVEPSGEAFNSISLKPGTGQPRNPMINAGAIAATGIIAGKSVEERFGRILSAFSDFAASPLQVDESVYQSESRTGFRNRAIGNMLRNFSILEEEVDPVLEAYFRQCSILVSCRSLSVMGATLANGGVNPITSRRVLSRATVEKVTSVMSTCGMYDYSGNWAFEVGIPAKSGVGGGIIGVLPGQLSIAVFSPLLDRNYNSVRGIATFRDLARSFGLHLLNQPSLTNYVISRSYTLADFTSTRFRRRELQSVLQQEGRRVRVFELQGDLYFGAVERVIHAYSRTLEENDRVIFDLTRVGQIHEATHGILVRFARQAFQKGKRIALVDPKGIFTPEERNALFPAAFVYDECNQALEDSEESLLAQFTRSRGQRSHLRFEEMDFVQNLTAADLAGLQQNLRTLEFPEGARIIAQGTAPEEVYFLAAGVVGIVVRSGEKAEGRQISSLGPGLSFGELSFLQGTTRTADVVALSPVTCYSLSREAIRRFRSSHPEGYLALVHNAMLTLSDRLIRANREVAALK